MKKSLFSSEREMQDWLSKELNEDVAIADLIVNIEKFENYKPVSLEAKKIFKSFEYSLKSLNLTSIISEGINISFKPEDSLKPDFLLYAPETESIVIIEIKNAGHATREGGTEIGAYASEIKSYIPFISDGDVVNVIIAPEWPTLIRHYIFHEIFWLQRNIICLTPLSMNNEIKLEIIDINSIVESDVSFKLGYNHLGGFQLCLYDFDLYAKPETISTFSIRIEQMKTAANAMAAKGNSQRGHGFAFLWKNKTNHTLSPFNITIINFSPFQSIERFFHDLDFEPNEITQKFVEIIREHDPTGHGESLIAITDIGIKFLEDFSTPREEGYMNWDSLKDAMLCAGELISFHPWGVFSEQFSEKLLQAYKTDQHHLKSDNPQLGLDLLDELIDPNYDYFNLAYYLEDDDISDDFEQEKNMDL